MVTELCLASLWMRDQTDSLVQVPASAGIWLLHCFPVVYHTRPSAAAACFGSVYCREARPCAGSGLLHVTMGFLYVEWWQPSLRQQLQCCVY